MGIIHALMRHVLDVFAPGTGRRRGATRPAVDVPERAPEATLVATSALPAHRSPYGLNTPLDGAATAMVRPYLAAVERKRECAFRSRSRGRTPSCSATPARTRRFAEAS